MEVVSDKQPLLECSSNASAYPFFSVYELRGWVFGTWLSPSHLDYLEGTNHGTNGTCVFQGFILQLGGIASFAFNSSLAATFLLKIRYSWREDRLYKLDRWLQGILWSICLVSAIVPLCLNMYHNTGPVCYIDSYRKFSLYRVGQRKL